jgi:hypothetical protein
MVLWLLLSFSSSGSTASRCVRARLFLGFRRGFVTGGAKRRKYLLVAFMSLELGHSPPPSLRGGWRCGYVWEEGDVLGRLFAGERDLF